MVEEKPSWSYISRVPRSSVIAEVKGAAVAWLILMVISGGIMLTVDLGSLIVEPITSRVEVPGWLRLAVGFAFFLWLMRDHGLAIAHGARSLSKVQCGVIVAVQGAVFYAWAHLHWLIGIGVTWGLVVAVFSLGRLSAEGRTAVAGEDC